MGLHTGLGGHITNHLRLGSILLMCCMYSCFHRGSKHHKLSAECFIHCLLYGDGLKMWSFLSVLVCMYGRDPLCWRKCHSNSDNDLSGFLRYFKHEIMHTHRFTHWWKFNETFSLWEVSTDCFYSSRNLSPFGVKEKLVLSVMLFSFIEDSMSLLHTAGVCYQQGGDDDDDDDDIFRVQVSKLNWILLSFCKEI